ncbi:MAG TPA: hypothetical protein VD837_10095 [Terriglobales bacterium]|nr:hypothetical protein [Terriglobales bacterium]
MASKIIRMRIHFHALCLCICVALLCLSASAAELKPATLNAFNRYVLLAEQEMQLTPAGPYLYADRLNASEREADGRRLKQGEVVIRRMKTLDSGKKIEVPDGLVHHWLALVFIPGATLQQTLALVQDYHNHHKYYAPDVVRSQLISRNGNDFRIFYRLKRHKVITVVLNTNYDVHYGSLSPTRAFSRSYSTRITEVENAGEQDEREKPVDDGTGFMWRLNTYWRFEQRDGGTYVQCEAVSLSRDIPTGLGWMIGPFVESVPRDSLEFTLRKTREALLSRR